MGLHREGGLALHRQTLHRPIVEVHVRHPGAVAERVEVDHEAVVLGGDLDFPGGQILHRLVAAVVAELELRRAAAQRQAEDLMAEADAEHRHLAEQLRDVLGRAGDAIRIAGAVGEEDTIRAQREHVTRRGAGGHDAHRAPAVRGRGLYWMPSWVATALDGGPPAGAPALAGGGAPAALPGPLPPAVAPRAGPLADETAAALAGPSLPPPHQALGVEVG